jgi:BCD family chlorophyll transporter-like MFS transporter
MEPREPCPETRFSTLRAFKLGSFHVGSSLSDLITSAVWNRVMITDLGVAAWPVALLSALRYLLAPLSLWAGHRSDTRPLFGTRRLGYIGAGRVLMLISLPALPVSILAITVDRSSLTGWALAILSFVIYGAGTLISGAPYLGLVHDSAPYARRGQAVAIVHFVLVTSFAFVPVLYARLMPRYDPSLFIRVVAYGMAGAAFFWLFSLWGEERRSVVHPSAEKALLPLRQAIARIWGNPRARRYGVFLFLSAFFAFMQDAMLEPFGGDVFGLSVGETTRFNAYWGVGVLAGMAGALVVTRRKTPDQQVHTTSLGLILLALPLMGLGTAAYVREQGAVIPLLMAFGLGFGVFTVGGTSLLMAMSEEDMAGSYLALWSVIQLLARGAGIAAGGIARDVVLAVSGQITAAYGTLFCLEGIGLVLSLVLLWRVDIAGFASRRGNPSTNEVLANVSG